MIAGLVAVALAVVLPLAPVNMSTPSVTWPQDTTSPQSTSLQLASQIPRGLEIRFSCQTARAAEETSDGTLLATINPDQPVAVDQGLVVSVLDGRVQIDAVGDGLVDEPVSDGACGYRIDGGSGGLRVSRDGTEIASTEDLPDIDVLATSLTGLPGAGADDLSVRVFVDNQMASSPTLIKTVMLVLMLFAAAVSAWALVQLDRSRRRIDQDDDRREPPDPPRGPVADAALGRPFPQRSLLFVDAVVVLVLVIWVFLAPASDDDGYYAAMARNAPFEGYVGNYFQLYNQNFTPFTWFYNVLSLWQGVGNSAVVLRIPALACGLLTWVLLRRFVIGGPALPAAVRSSPRGMLAAVAAVALVFLAWWMPYDMGVRPEAVVAVLALATLVGVTAGIEARRLTPIAAAVGAAGLGFTCHPTGFICLAPLIVGAPKIWALLRADDGALRGTLARGVAVLSPGALASAATFSDGTLHDFLRGQAIFLSIQEQNSMFDEWQRYGFLLNQIPMGNYAKRTAVLIAIISLVWFLIVLITARQRRVEIPPRLVSAGFALGLAFLLFWLTPSKWTHHFGAMAGLGAAFLGLFLVSLPFVIRSLRDSGLRVPTGVTIFAAVSTIAVIALAMHGPNDWPYNWLLGMPDPGKSPDVLFIELDSLLWWALGLAGIIAVLHRIFARRQLGGWRGLTAVTAIPALVLVFLLTSVGYLGGSFAMATVRTLDSYSPYASAIRDPLANNCDAAGGIDVLDESTAAPLSRSNFVSEPVEPPSGFVSNGGFFTGMPPAATPGTGMATDLWGSLTGPDGEDGVGSFTSPWFVLPESLADDERLVVTASGQLGAGNELEVQYAGADALRVRSEQEITDEVNAPFWRSFELDLDEGELVRLVARDVSGGVGGWLAFTGPTVQQMTTLQSYLPEDAAVGVAWPVAFLFPCQRQPRISSGIAEPIEFAVVWGQGVDGLYENTWVLQRGGLYAAALREASITNVIAEIQGAADIQSFSVYRVDRAYAAAAYDLSRDSVTVMGWQGPPSD
ncbi:MAG: arabinosyltransferase domain-containing protein [Actinomycetota bacterium]|nr:arabinosyltransferase domain-containing protein [Actinomycetota bacterium]